LTTKSSFDCRTKFGWWRRSMDSGYDDDDVQWTVVINTIKMTPLSLFDYILTF